MSDKYTDPELRQYIKEDVQAGDKGGHEGQWSARKAQMVASEYKKQMHERGEEPYKTSKDEQSKTQKSLTKWGEEDWQTSDGSGTARKEDGTETRYLPKEAWEKMTDDEKEETNIKKEAGSKEGKQYVANTKSAKEARKDADEDGGSGRDSHAVILDIAEEKNGGGRNTVQAKGGHGDNSDRKLSDDESLRTDPSAGKNAAGGESVQIAEASTDSDFKTGTSKEEPQIEPAYQSARVGRHEAHSSADNQLESKKRDVDEVDYEGGESIAPSAKKPRRSDSPKCDENNVCSPPGGGLHESNDRLPEVGQRVSWKASGTTCEGEVVEILHSEKTVNGRTAKASESDPRIILKNAKSGKTVVHKPSVIHF